MLSLRRATTEQDLLARLLALWEAIEFYVSGVQVPTLFTKRDLKAIRASLPELTEAQQKRAVERVGHFNEPSLMIKLAAQLDEDGVPIDDSELELLEKLRKLRNNVVHGRSSERPLTDDVEYATSIVARMLVFHASRSALGGVRRGG